MSESRAAALRTLLFASSAAGMLVAAPAVAADAGDSVIVTADQQQPANLGTIDVNGQVRKPAPHSPEYVAPLLDTPRSVTVIPQAIIEQTGADSLQDILRNSPGITFGAGEGGQPLADRPVIRGQSSGNNIFVDGVRDTGGQQREVFNLEQVEIIKGGGLGLFRTRFRRRQHQSGLQVAKTDALHQCFGGYRHGRLPARHDRRQHASGRDSGAAHQSDGGGGRCRGPRRRGL